MNNKIIIAMDMEIEDGIELIQNIEFDKEIQRMIYGYKVGSLWMIERGTDVLEEVQYELTKHVSEKIILDMQKWGTDIPDIIEKQVYKVSPFIDELICCPMGSGSESLKMFAKICIKNKIKPICVLKMTHPKSNRYLIPGYDSLILQDAIESEIYDFVIPATKEPIENDRHQFEFYTSKGININKYATGFKVQGGQVKPMVDFGVTKFIVGRAIYETKDPIKTIKDIYKEINGE